MLYNKYINKSTLEAIMDREKLIKYADLLLHTGVALEKGQPVIINGNTENYEFIQLLAQRAYVNGAS
ncbi:MAG: aminopeptidase, partial [Clostridia bacterium]|nr:aminopeptidase [Clostridia bacterium]